MIKIENVEVMNFKNAIRGARNPLESWDKIDSGFGCGEDFCESCSDRIEGCYSNNFTIGEQDLNLLQRLIRAGSDERKFMRQIIISVDITAPLYWWKEEDTYKIGTVANSCSTMHKLATTPITKECFSFDKENDDLYIWTDEEVFGCTTDIDYIGWCVDQVIDNCENIRLKYLETKDIRYWRALIQLLPESWNQKRTITLNYEVFRNMYFARRNHKLSEWKEFCKWIETLPYGKDLICLEDNIA